MIDLTELVGLLLNELLKGDEQRCLQWCSWSLRAVVWHLMQVTNLSKFKFSVCIGFLWLTLLMQRILSTIYDMTIGADLYRMMILSSVMWDHSLTYQWQYSGHLRGPPGPSSSLGWCGTYTSCFPCQSPSETSPCPSHLPGWLRGWLLGEEE